VLSAVKRVEMVALEGRAAVMVGMAEPPQGDRGMVAQAAAAAAAQTWG